MKDGGGLIRIAIIITDTDALRASIKVGGCDGGNFDSSASDL